MPDDWIPESCTLPTVEQPLRRTEFDDLFAEDVVAVEQRSPSELRLELRADPNAAMRAASLATRETGCCSFFAFVLAITDGKVEMTISTGPAHEPVLAALAARAGAKAGA